MVQGQATWEEVSLLSKYLNDEVGSRVFVAASMSGGRCLAARRRNSTARSSGFVFCSTSLEALMHLHISKNNVCVHILGVDGCNHQLSTPLTRFSVLPLACWPSCCMLPLSCSLLTILQSFTPPLKSDILPERIGTRTTLTSVPST